MPGPRVPGVARGRLLGPDGRRQCLPPSEGFIVPHVQDTADEPTVVPEDVPPVTSGCTVGDGPVHHGLPVAVDPGPDALAPGETPHVVPEGHVAHRRFRVRESRCGSSGGRSG